MRRECRERFPRHRLQRKPQVIDPDMHHDTRVTHVPWCMLGSLTRGGGEKVPGIPGACAPAILRIWQEAHEVVGPHSTTCWVHMVAGQIDGMTPICCNVPSAWLTRSCEKHNCSETEDAFHKRRFPFIIILCPVKKCKSDTLQSKQWQVRHLGDVPI